MLGLASRREHSFHTIEKPKTAELQIVTAILIVTRDTKNSSLVDCLELLDMIFLGKI
jgi:hypothetical protein